jgi:hypothetical protein
VDFVDSALRVFLSHRQTIYANRPPETSDSPPAVRSAVPLSPLCGCTPLGKTQKDGRLTPGREERAERPAPRVSITHKLLKNHRPSAFSPSAEGDK